MLVSLKTGSDSSHLILIFKVLVTSLPSSAKNLAEILIEIALNLYIDLRRADIFTIVNPPNCEHGTSLHLVMSSFSFSFKFL